MGLVNLDICSLEMDQLGVAMVGAWFEVGNLGVGRWEVGMVGFDGLQVNRVDGDSLEGDMLCG